DPLLVRYEPDVLILDVFVPTSPDNPNPFPILQAIPKWLQLYPQLSVLVISMYSIRTLVKAIMEAGASGYIIKDDQATIRELDSVIRTVAQGGVYLSREVYKYLINQSSEGSLLTSRQQQALSLSAAYPDSTTAELADRLGVAHSTMRNLLSEAYLRLNVHSRTAAMVKAKQLGLITPQEPKIDP
ncbi:MAG: response regulator transcription factor, partial [Anaerolineales bacterium]